MPRMKRKKGPGVRRSPSTKLTKGNRAKPKREYKRKATKGVSGSAGKRKAPREAHTGKKLQKRNNPFKVKAVGGAARPPKPNPMGRPQGKKKKPQGVGGRRKKR